jgi:glycosyltransferase involved in cell wall biosynthesis
MVPLSAVLIAQDEEKTIGDALASVAFCDEVVVVDSGSRDGTRAIAEAAGARVIVNAPWPGFVAQRDFATRAACHDWVLPLDADERVGAALREEIEALRRRGFGAAGYRIPRVAWYLGRWIRGTDWYPDWQVRLFDRTRGGWQGDLVHESFAVRGAVGRLRGDLEHHPYVDISDHLRKIDSYTTLWARQAFAAGRRSNVLDMSAGASWAFFRNYVLKRGFLLGSAGFVISVLNTHYTFAKLAKLRELERAAREPRG